MIQIYNVVKPFQTFDLFTKENLNNHKKIIFDLISENHRMFSFKTFDDIKSSKTLINKLDWLEEQNLIEKVENSQQNQIINTLQQLFKDPNVTSKELCSLFHSLSNKVDILLFDTKTGKLCKSVPESKKESENKKKKESENKKKKECQCKKKKEFLTTHKVVDLDQHHEEIMISNYFNLQFYHRMFGLDYDSISTIKHDHNILIKISILSQTLNKDGMIFDSKLFSYFQKDLDANLSGKSIVSKDDQEFIGQLKSKNNKYFLIDGNSTIENIARLINKRFINMFIDVVEFNECHVELIENGLTLAKSIKYLT